MKPTKGRRWTHMCSGMVSCCYSTSGTHRITLDKSPVMSLSVNSYEHRNAEMIWLRQKENLPGHLLIQTFWNVYLSHDGDRKSFDVNILTLPLETIGTVAFFIAETLSMTSWYEPQRISSEVYIPYADAAAMLIHMLQNVNGKSIKKI